MYTDIGKYRVPFWISSDYYEHVLNSDPRLINSFPKLQREMPEINEDHSDLHIYPYTEAIPAILSMGCNNTCDFCPTGQKFKGKIYYGDAEFILRHYKNKNVHFLDENFFQNDMDIILPLLKKYNIYWLAMAHYKETMELYDKYGEDYLYECGLRVIEIGLENISLMRKVEGEGIPNGRVAIYYLNLSFLPGETIETIQCTAEWMKRHSLNNAIYSYNGTWFSPGQYYFPYRKEVNSGIMLDSYLARVRPTFVPDSFLEQEVTIVNAELVNRYVHFTYSKDFQLYPEAQKYNVRIFIDNDYRKAMWLAIGIRVGGVI